MHLYQLLIFLSKAYFRMVSIVDYKFPITSKILAHHYHDLPFSERLHPIILNHSISKYLKLVYSWFHSNRHISSHIVTWFNNFFLCRTHHSKIQMLEQSSKNELNFLIFSSANFQLSIIKISLFHSPLQPILKEQLLAKRIHQFSSRNPRTPWTLILSPLNPNTFMRPTSKTNPREISLKIKKKNKNNFRVRRIRFLVWT